MGREKARGGALRGSDVPEMEEGPGAWLLPGPQNPGESHTVAWDQWVMGWLATKQ